MSKFQTVLVLVFAVEIVVCSIMIARLARLQAKLAEQQLELLRMIAWVDPAPSEEPPA